MVESSSIASIGYDKRALTLEVEFRSGALYRYREVPEALHSDLMRATSKGRYFAQKIRGKFPCERITGRAR